MENPASQRPIPSPKTPGLPTPGSQPPMLHISKEMQPVYANLVRITHMPSELVFDFALKMPGNAPAEVMSQVLMSPLSAKLFFRAMAENLAKYEQTFGEIRIPGEDALVEYSKLFRPPKGPDQPPES